MSCFTRRFDRWSSCETILTNSYVDMTPAPTPDNQTPSHGAQLVRSLLERHTVPKHRQAAFVRDFFHLSRAAAHQRLGRSTAWTLDELQQIAAHFGESLTEVLGGEAQPAGTPATLRVGGLQVGCRIWLSEVADAAHHDAFVALENAGGYVVVPAAAPPVQGARRVARLEIDQATAVLPRIAVLDDTPDFASSLCEQLGRAGLNASGFSTAAALTTALAETPFDGYVINWSRRDPDASALLASLRAQPKHVAVVLLTGKLRSGSRALNDIAAAASTFKVQVFEKPVHLPLLLSALENDGLRTSGRP